MDVRPYKSEFINEYSGILQHIITVLALTINTMLLRILKASKQSGIGSYQYLIAFFCLSDILYTIVHWLVYPIPETYTNAGLLSGYGLLRSRFAACFYVAVYMHSFPIIAFHFLYRVLAIRKPLILREPAAFFIALIAATCAVNLTGLYVTYVLFGPDEESMALLRPFFAGNSTSPVIHNAQVDGAEFVHALYYAGATFEHPRWKCLAGAGILTAVIFVTYIVILACSFLINDFLKANAASDKTIELHRQIFRSLICQVIYPLVTTYFPLSVCVLFPTVGLNFNWVSIICPPSCVTHPLFNPLFLIACIPEYRHAFLRNLGLSRLVMKKQTVTPNSSKASIKTPKITVQSTK